MADLRLPRRTGDRGQLVLVTGLAIAIAMVALVLLLNTAIYTQNLATRDAATGEREALEHRASVEEGVGAVIDAENAAEYDTYAAVEANASASVDRTDRLIARSRVESGAAARINRSTISYHEGRLVRQTDSSRRFLDATDTLADWNIALNVTDTRQFAATVDRNSLATTDAANATSDGFHVQVNANATTTKWNAAVYNNSSTGDIAVAVEPPSASRPTQVCSVDRSQATVDFTAGALAGEPCPGMAWAEGVSGAYDLKYVNGDKVRGTYNLTVNVSSSLTFVNTPLQVNDDPADGSPYAVPAVYDATFTLRYETSGIRYRSTVRVAPGESDA